MEDNHLSLPLFLQTCFKNIQDNVKTEGIFRISPKLVDINAFCNEINKSSNCSALKPEMAIGIVKRFLKSLPTPLLGAGAWHLMKSLTTSTFEEKHKKIYEYVNSLPECNKFMLKHLFCLFDFIDKNKECNKMDYSNLSIVLAPNFLWGESSLHEMFQDSLAAVEFVNFLLVNHLTLLDYI
uniref:Rho GTPase-activating protein 68F (Trinotate prediction) n=1 Tax=Myxobolus squamalis TaxID=59785 RepID=A0A6B2FZK5_MYXSQ